MVNQPAILQGGEGAGHDFLAPVIVQHLLAQAVGMRVQQAGENFFSRSLSTFMVTSSWE